MSTHKHIDKICAVVLVFTLLIGTLFVYGEALGIELAPRTVGYENRIFDTSRVHTIDIVMNDWDSFIETCTDEEYVNCSVVIDGEAYKNVAIRAKGNTSLSNVKSMNSDRYSFKIEFDHYDSTKSYHGLDKLCLNNVIQDNTYMKDYLTYRLMDEFGVSAPLCSYASITVNGEPWGLYLAVEAVEDSFLLRNYGTSSGELYKPDSMSFGGGRGNGKDFKMEDIEDMFGSFDFSSAGKDGSARPSSDSGKTQNRGGDANKSGFSMGGNGGFGGFGGGFGMGSSDVKLQYIDDNASSYSNIFGNAKTDITEADQNRLISSLKQLSSYENLESVVDTEDVIRYFVVHNYVVNGDSYTGSMIHNYYLYEEDGRLSMIPWDYNLAFGTFMGGNASSSVNKSIDEVLSDRPMQAWIFSSEEYSERYYELYSEFVSSARIQQIIDEAYSLIASYVENDPSAFCSYGEFEVGVSTLEKFCELRSESVSLQLSGSNETVSTGDLNISAMGSMGGSMGGNKRPSSDKSWQERVIPTSFVPSGDFIPLDMPSDIPSDVPFGENPFGGTMPDWAQQFPSGTRMPDMNGETGEGGQSMPEMNFGNFSPSDSSSGRTPTGQGGTQTPGVTPSLDGKTSMIVSVAVLVGGLLFAALFKRRR